MAKNDIGRNFIDLIGMLGQKSYADEAYKGYQGKSPEPSPENLAMLAGKLFGNPFGQRYLDAESARLAAAQEDESRRRKQAEDARRAEMEGVLNAINFAGKQGYQMREGYLPQFADAMSRGEVPQLPVDKFAIPPRQEIGPAPKPRGTIALAMEKKPESKKYTNIKAGPGGLYGITNGMVEFIEGSENLAVENYDGPYNYDGEKLWGWNRNTGVYEPMRGSENMPTPEKYKRKTGSSSSGGLTRAQKGQVSGYNADIEELDRLISEKEAELARTSKTAQDRTPGSPTYGQMVPSAKYQQIKSDLEGLRAQRRNKQYRRDALKKNETVGGSDQSRTPAKTGGGF